MFDWRWDENAGARSGFAATAHLSGKMTGAPWTTDADTLPVGVFVPCLMHMGKAADRAGGRMNRTSPAKLSGLYVVGASDGVWVNVLPSARLT